MFSVWAMRRFLILIALLCATAVCLAKQGELVLLTSADNPPYEFTRSGTIVGFDIDLAKVIAEKLGKKLVIKDMPFASILPALISKQGDLAMAAITPTDARRENVDFSIPYQNNVSAIVLVNGVEFAHMENAKATFPLALLEGKTVGVQLGTHHEADILAVNVKDLSVKRYDNIGTMVAAISNSANGRGSLYALVIGVPEAQMLIKKNPKLCFFQLKFSDSFAVAFPKNSPLRSDINRIIKLLAESGKLSDLEIKWDIGQ
ncbi:MAG: transporter substrate-binding domain-containing protein [Puniceicoccales bacterium]|nr:transporter substrate-binding domain-containing protein [Puniceicoccales bacterium]